MPKKDSDCSLCDENSQQQQEEKDSILIMDKDDDNDDDFCHEDDDDADEWEDLRENPATTSTTTALCEVIANRSHASLVVVSDREDRCLRDEEASSYTSDLTTSSNTPVPSATTTSVVVPQNNNSSCIMDGGIPSVIEEVDTEEENDDDDEVSLTTLGYRAQRRIRRKLLSKSSPPRRYYYVYALALWFAQIAIVISLKRLGILDKAYEFNDSVVQSVLPHLSYLNNLNETATSLSYLMTEEIRPGYQLAQQGARAHYPIVMVPGFVTSGLEVWGGKKCAKRYFRQRFWAALTGARIFAMDTACWKEHMQLDPYTGGDPESGNDNDNGSGGADNIIRLRASEGFAAADYFLANYWVWGKLIENLADVGYTPSTMTMEPYDWRLPFAQLEIRDGYFTKLMYRIESMHKSQGKKIVLATHSMGAIVLHHFFAWVTRSEKEGGGGGGRDWVDKHIEIYVNIAGCHLGVPKAMSALLSGEMKDTVFMGTMGNMVEQFFGRRMRRELWSTWGSLWSMLPKGGEALWGPGADMCDAKQRASGDPFCPESELEISPLITMTDGAAKDFSIGIEDAMQSGTNLNTTLKDFVSKDKHYTEETIQFLQTYGSGFGPNSLGSTLNLYGKAKKIDKSVWHDPSRTPLPHAPNLKIFCFYGTGLPTERGFNYKINWDENSESDKPSRKISDPPLVLDPIDNKEHNISYGIRYSDGDGSVPLISLGYICADGWQRKSSGLNPSRSQVYVREYKHEQKFTVDDPMRGGPASSDHVDILGNIKMTEDFLRVVTNFETKDVNTNHIVSDIKSISKRINKRGGIYKGKLNRWLSKVNHVETI